MSIVVRYAPSPTYLLSIADARMALLNWLFAVQSGGTFLLRLDDIVTDSSAAEFAIGIERDLLWLGLEWGAFARQSERQDRHREAVERLRADGRIYADATNGEQWRFRIDPGETVWDDLLQDGQAIDITGLDDPVVVRADGTVLRALSAVVDDIDFAVSHVIRGENRLADTALQLQVFAALDAEAPRFGHLPSLAGVMGGANAGHGGPTVEAVRDAGIESMALNSMLIGLGRGGSIVPCYQPSDLVEGFDLTAYGGPPPSFNMDQLRKVNAALLRGMPFEMAEKRLASMGLELAGEGFWLAVRRHLDTFARAAEWYRTCFSDVPPIVEDLDLILTACDALPEEPWDETTWETWVKQVATKTGKGAGGVARSLRLAVTGTESGPGMDLLLPMIGRDRVVERLGGRGNTNTRR